MTLETYSTMLIAVYMGVGCGGEDPGEPTVTRDKHKNSHYLMGWF